MGTPVEPQDNGNTDPTVEVQGNTETPGPNPAWNDVLSVIPEQFHSAITPHFQKWDQAANARIESVNQQYADYKPFVDHSIGRDQLEQGLRLMQMINDNPQQVYEALAQSLGVQQQPSNESNPNDSATGNENQQQYELPPDYATLKQGVEKMAEMMMQQQREREEAVAEANLDRELKSIREKYGDFNEAHFLPYLSNAVERNLTPMQAAESFFAMRDEIIKGSQQAPYAPKILGSNSGNGAGLPSNKIDVSKLSRGETKNLVVEYLKAAQQQP